MGSLVSLYVCTAAVLDGSGLVAQAVSDSIVRPIKAVLMLRFSVLATNFILLFRPRPREVAGVPTGPQACVISGGVILQGKHPKFS